MTGKSKGLNWLLQGFILVSLAVHILLFLHLTGIYQGRAMSYIELTMQAVSKPNVRVIPKPRIREKKYQVSRVTPLDTQKTKLSRIKIDPVENFKTDYRQERISLPDLPDTITPSGFQVPAFAFAETAGDIEPHEVDVEFGSAKDYFEMLNLRIEREKKYPEAAKSRQQEGRVKIQFILMGDGTLTDIKIIKRSRYKNLDRAAVQAIKDASPFPKPPAYILKPPVMLKISILFELA